MKLNIKYKLFIYLTLIPLVIFIVVSLFFKQNFEKSNIENITEILNKDLSKHITSIKSAYNVIIQNVKNTSLVLKGTDNLSKTKQKEIIDEILKNIIEENENITSIWIDWELSYINNEWKKPFGRERHIIKKDYSAVNSEINILDTLEENTNSYHYKCKISANEIFLNPLYNNEKSQTVNYFNSTYITPLTYNNKVIASIRVNMSFNYYNYFKISKRNAYKSFIASKEGDIIVHYEKSFEDKNLSTIFDDDFTEENNLIDIINNTVNTCFVGNDISTLEKEIYAFVTTKIVESSDEWIFVNATPYKIVINLTLKQYIILLIFGIIIISIIGYLTLKFGNKISTAFNSTSIALKNLSLGDINMQYKLAIDSNDEIGEMANLVNNVIDGFNTTASYAKEIGKGNLSADYKQLSENDIIGESLKEMKDNLQQAKIEEDKRRREDEKLNWFNQGQAQFGDILRENTDNLEEFGYNIISNLVKYINANIGGLYIINEGEDKEKSIELIACYAYDRKKYINKSIVFGEGLVSRCILEKESIFLKDIPDNYINITSGLGYEKPKNLLLVPLLLNEEVFGVIELASFNEIESHIIGFIEKIGQSIASTISTVKINIQTSQLLEESKQQSEELAAQEEEMRQNLEELQATQEESTRRANELSSTFSALNSSLLVAEYDLDGKIISMNDDYAKMLGINNREFIDDNFKKMLVSFDISENEIKSIWNKIKKGEIVKKIMELNINDEYFWINQTFAPIIDMNENVSRILNIGVDITEMKLQEQQVEDLLNETQQKNKKLVEAQNEIAFEKYLFDTLLANVPQRVFFKDRESKFIRASKSLLKKVNLDKQEDLIGKSDFDLLRKEFAEKTFKDEQGIMNSRKALINFEEYEKKPDGEEIWKIVSKIPMINEKDECIGLFGIINEITEFKKLEKELKEKNKMLEDIKKKNK